MLSTKYKYGTSLKSSAEPELLQKTPNSEYEAFPEPAEEKAVATFSERGSFAACLFTNQYDQSIINILTAITIELFQSETTADVESIGANRLASSDGGADRLVTQFQNFSFGFR